MKVLVIISIILIVYNEQNGISFEEYNDPLINKKMINRMTNNVEEEGNNNKIQSGIPNQVVYKIDLTENEVPNLNILSIENEQPHKLSISLLFNFSRCKKTNKPLNNGLDLKESANLYNQKVEIDKHQQFLYHKIIAKNK